MPARLAISKATDGPKKHNLVQRMEERGPHPNSDGVLFEPAMLGKRRESAGQEALLARSVHPCSEPSPVPNRVWRLLTAPGRAISTTGKSIQVDSRTGVGEQVGTDPNRSKRFWPQHRYDLWPGNGSIRSSRCPIIGKAGTTFDAFGFQQLPDPLLELFHLGLGGHHLQHLVGSWMVAAEDRGAPSCTTVQGRNVR